ncbi:MAG: hypothetical protein J5I53_09600 [Bradyrhizobiaceae bacterium]|nr:hypothetical protein [Bradyrhizobiaceae bacterium]
MRSLLMLLCFCVLGTMVCTAQLELRKSGAVVASDYEYTDKGRLFASVGFVTAGYIQSTNVHGFLGFYPISLPPKVNSVTETLASVKLWPQPATTFLRIENLPSEVLEGRFANGVVVTNIYGQQTTISADRINQTTLQIDVRNLTPGTYALGVGSGVIIRVGV